MEQEAGSSGLASPPRLAAEGISEHSHSPPLVGGKISSQLRGALGSATMNIDYQATGESAGDIGFKWELKTTPSSMICRQQPQRAFMGLLSQQVISGTTAT